MEVPYPESSLATHPNEDIYISCIITTRTQLSLNIIQPSKLLRKRPLKRIGIRIQLYQKVSTTIHLVLGETTTHIAELHLTQFSQRADNISPNLVCDIELRQAHIRRAEEGIFGSHDDGGARRTRPSSHQYHQGKKEKEREKRTASIISSE